MSMPLNTRNIIHDYAAEDRRHMIAHASALKTLEEVLRERELEEDRGEIMLGRVILTVALILFVLAMFALPNLLAWALGLGPVQ
jgi:hypothetical protein